MTLHAPVLHQLVPSISGGNILSAMGVDPGGQVRPRLLRLVDEVRCITMDEARPGLVWRNGKAEDVLNCFPPSRRLARYLNDADSAVIVAATAGKQMEARIMQERDSMRAYVLGAAATAVARNTLVQARRLLAQEHTEAGIADSLSPGTDGLPFKFQHSLLNILPMDTIGITLDSETLLMKPLASVTAIIAYGRNLPQTDRLDACEETNPHCESCPSRGCQLRLKPYTPRRASA